MNYDNNEFPLRLLHQCDLILSAQVFFEIINYITMKTELIHSVVLFLMKQYFVLRDRTCKCDSQSDSSQGM
jgi:hypothetical protein